MRLRVGGSRWKWKMINYHFKILYVDCDFYYQVNDDTILLPSSPSHPWSQILISPLCDIKPPSHSSSFKHQMNNLVKQVRKNKNKIWNEKRVDQ